MFIGDGLDHDPAIDSLAEEDVKRRERELFEGQGATGQEGGADSQPPKTGPGEENGIDDPLSIDDIDAGDLDRTNLEFQVETGF